MLRSLGLILPALIPSWNFFDVIAPSPRIEYAVLQHSDDEPTEWRSFRPRPQHISLLTMLRRMFWNPWWNETLYTMSLSERLIANPTTHSEDEILSRIRHDVMANDPDLDGYLKFRLVFVYRENQALEEEILFTSRVKALDEKA